MAAPTGCRYAARRRDGSRAELEGYFVPLWSRRQSLPEVLARDPSEAARARALGMSQATPEPGVQLDEVRAVWPLVNAMVDWNQPDRLVLDEERWSESTLGWVWVRIDGATCWSGNHRCGVLVW